MILTELAAQSGETQEYDEEIYSSTTTYVVTKEFFVEFYDKAYNHPKTLLRTLHIMPGDTFTEEIYESGTYTVSLVFSGGERAGTWINDEGSNVQIQGSIPSNP